MTIDEAKEWLHKEVPTEILLERIYEEFKLELEAEYQRGRDSILSRSCEGCKFAKLEYECGDERYFCMHSDINFQHYPPYRFYCSEWKQK